MNRSVLLRRRRRVKRPLKTNAGYGLPIPSASMQPFSLNQIGTLLPRLLAHSVSDIDAITDLTRDQVSSTKKAAGAQTLIQRSQAAAA
jgi:hypothetical protein